MKLSDILPNPENPRVLRDEKFAKLKQSIQDFPKMMSLRPIVIDNMGMILGGNIRYRALQELGFKEIPETWVKRAEELTAEEKRRFIIADNVGFGEWDWDELASNWDVEQLEEWGLDVPSFGGEEPEANFSDPGIADKDQYAVIVMAKDEKEQKQIFDRLTDQGMECKIVVT